MSFRLPRAFRNGIIALPLILMITGCEKVGREELELKIVDSQGQLQKAAQVFPKTSLRGYGTVSAQRWDFAEDGVAGSILQIDCQDQEKAKLTHAKYVSDLQVLPGVKKIKSDSSSGAFTAYEIEGQGAILATRSANNVMILAGGSVDHLKKLLGGHVRGKQVLSSNPEVEVPMWLDRWDRFGFRFYYAEPFKTPKGTTQETYDYSSEFRFAQEHAGAGMLFFNPPSRADTAEGLTDENLWNWAAEECARLKLPVGMQLSYGGQTWLANRFRNETMQKMPGFCGDRFNILHDQDGGQGFPSWCGKEVRSTLQGMMQNSVRQWNRYENITSWNHPDSEFQHGFDQMMEYGPVADASYREYLKETYGNLETIAKRWTDKADAFRSWNDVRVPEFAIFGGWGPNAFDLAGDWRIRFQEPYVDGKQVPPPADWVRADFNDSNWPTLPAPGHDRAMLLLRDDPQKPKWHATPFQQAVYRRNFTLPDDWQAKNPRTWLYVWDLNMKWGATVSAYLNGEKAGEDLLRHGKRHWWGMEVTHLLKKGSNQVSLVLPDGGLGYRVYLAPTPPAQHPYLGRELNEQWVDFTNWVEWSRLKSVEESAAMIREVDPSRGISYMDKNGFGFWRAGTKRLAVKYGGEIHNTGYMGGIWSDDMAMLSRSSDLPCSVEPGAPAADAKGFLNLLGLYSVEGVQGIDYFQHIGDIFWPDGIRDTFNENWKLINLLGKYHAPKAEVAILLAANRWQMCEYTAAQVHPEKNLNLDTGYWVWNSGDMIIPEYDRDAVSEYDFADGNALKYKILLDTNTAIMSEKLVSDIEKYVQDGGVFVTFVQTGRHTPTQADSWPISRLTGYRVAGIDRYRPDGSMETERSVEVLPGQEVFPADAWRSAPKGNGLSLVKIADDCIDLMRWEDGSIAVGMRPLGKGYIVQLGAKFTADSIWRGRSPWTARMFTDLMEHFKITRVPASFSGVAAEPYSDPRPGSVPPPDKHARSVMFRHYISNNGLYDVWTLWNSTKQPISIDFSLDPINQARFAFNVKTNEQLPIEQIRKLSFTPLETKVFLTPRNQIGNASSEWFALQRGWWQGTEKPKAASLSEFKPKFAIDLAPDWDFIPVKSQDQAAALVFGSAVADQPERRRLGIWGLSDHQGLKHALFKKEITIPQEWADGEVRLWFLFDHGAANVTYVPAFVGEARIYVDGKVVRDFQSLGVMGMVLPSFKPGTKHELEVEIKGANSLVGLKGATWLNFVPAPAESISLAGAWQASDDALNFNKQMVFPGEWDAYVVKRTIDIPERFKGRNVVAHIEHEGTGPQGVIINGKWLRKSFQTFGSRLDFNITPWVKFGEPNEIEFAYVADGRGQGPTKFKVKHVSLDMHNPEVFP